MTPYIIGYVRPDGTSLCVHCVDIGGTEVPEGATKIFSDALPGTQLRNCGRCEQRLGEAARKVRMRLTEAQKAMFVALEIPFENTILRSCTLNDTQVGVLVMVQDLGGGNVAEVPLAVLCDDQFFRACPEFRDAAGELISDPVSAASAPPPKPKSRIII